MTKKYNAFTGVTGFYYMPLNSSEVKSITEPERIKYLQEIQVSKEQSIEKAYGDNSVAELAVSNGTVELESTFHHLPIEDREVLFGLEKSDDGIIGVGNNTPPYVAVMFEKTTESGSSEYVGLLKGMFTFPEVSGQTKEDGVEFSQDKSTAEFMPAEVEGFDTEQTMLLGQDEKGTTTMRDAIFKKVFGKEHPDAKKSEELSEEEESTGGLGGSSDLGSGLGGDSEGITM
ncbi:phage tail protein [Staphylococcus pseudintermedius]|uniref:major tail protein n=1 Tax=Staphylococcus pseudintermedius TaxID=283734 RepID=UPI000C1C6ECE|nr:major tail protein [Staphylococcus pseudintermedius]EGQ0314112.1 phage tail protein [Staphylococcus pseudintermedius]EGQ0379315.1 phage tail protein [Staphylococcus pseudintermedius]EGQ0389616.1 phage tail protein [Staphylococcus pseudintermedius]EGQ1640328.1 phage tail protein [Staphylococcus pseudintermedius]EGQ1675949.1 phage tail protein [Staphylococcus pseudintermedius]